MAQAELRQPVPVAHPIQPRVLAGSHEIASGLQLARGHVDRLEQAAGEQPRELTRVPRIGLDPIARPGGTSPGATTTQSIPRSTR